MAGKEQNVVSHGLNAALANAEGEQEQQQVKQLASKLNSEAGAAGQQSETTTEGNLE